MGYWLNKPMGGDHPWDIQDNFRDELLNTLNIELFEKCYNNEDKCFEVENIKYFTDWLQYQCKTNEKGIMTVISNIIITSIKVNGFHYANLNEVCFAIPLSFLEWGVTLRLESELSKYLLILLKGTDGGSEDRGYSILENIYPNGINTPNDFIKVYIDKWNDLISGIISISSIDSTEELQFLVKNLYNTR